MRRTAGLPPLLLVLFLGVGADVAGADPPLPAESKLELRVAYPRAETEIDPAEPAFVAGDAFLELGPSDGLDAVLVLDVSASTGLYSGEDVDRDGVLHLGFAGPDSIGEAMALAAQRVVAELDQPGTRLALVSFSGNPPPGASAALAPQVAVRLEQALTADPARVRRALARVRARAPAGMTDMGGALAAALEALAPDGTGARRDRVVLFFTDGSPTSPFASSEANLRAALDVADRAAARGIRIHTFAVGPEALENPEAPIRIAERTGGYFTPVQNPTELAGLAAQVARASVRRVSVANRTLGRTASELVLGHDGSWSALVPIGPGTNVIQVDASALGDLVATRRIRVRGRKGAPPQAIPAELAAQRDSVLAERLARMRRETEALRTRLARELERRMERDRVRARAVRELEIRLSEPEEPASVP